MQLVDQISLMSLEGLKFAVRLHDCARRVVKPLLVVELVGLQLLLRTVALQLIELFPLLDHARP